MSFLWTKHEYSTNGWNSNGINYFTCYLLVRVCKLRLYLDNRSWSLFDGCCTSPCTFRACLRIGDSVHLVSSWIEFPWYTIFEQMKCFILEITSRVCFDDANDTTDSSPQIFHHRIYDLIKKFGKLDKSNETSLCQTKSFTLFPIELLLSENIGGIDFISDGLSLQPRYFIHQTVVVSSGVESCAWMRCRIKRPFTMDRRFTWEQVRMHFIHHFHTEPY